MKGTKTSTILVLGVLLALTQQTAWALNWFWEIVDGEESGSETGTFSNIVCDSRDRPRISYYDGGDNCLRFAAWNGTSWDRETVDSGGSSDEYAQGRFNCLVIDSKDRCHISYRDRRYYRLKYAVQDGKGGWDIQVVDDPSAHDPYGHGRVGVGRFTSIDLDGNDHPHISYTDLDNGCLKYARWNGSSWDVENVHCTGVYRAIQGTCIQIDSHDRPQIAFVDTTAAERFKCARWNGSSWDFQTIDPHSGSDHPTIMAVDSNDNLHVICGNFYFKSQGSVWTKEVIPGLVGGGTSIKLDKDEYPHIAITQNNNMWYAYYNGTDWFAQCADPSPEAGEERCLALDSKGVAHLSYWAQKFYDENQLRHATIICPTADTDDDGEVGWTDLKVQHDNWLWLGHPGDNPGDISCDGAVEFMDFALLAGRWLEGYGS